MLMATTAPPQPPADAYGLKTASETVSKPTSLAICIQQEPRLLVYLYVATQTSRSVVCNNYTPCSAVYNKQATYNNHVGSSMALVGRQYRQTLSGVATDGERSAVEEDQA